jgi:hypothetical protein
MRKICSFLVVVIFFASACLTHSRREFHPEFIKNRGFLYSSIYPVSIDSTSNIFYFVKIPYEKNEYYKIENFDNVIPFSHEHYDLIISALDISTVKINVVMINDRDTIFSRKITNHFDYKNSFGVHYNSIS